MKNELKKFLLKTIYKRKLKNLPQKKYKRTKIIAPKILILIDKRLDVMINDLNFIKDIFSISDENINFLWFDSNFVFDYPNHKRIDIDDINFSGKINNLFTKFKYDILFNFYDCDDIVLKYLSINIKNKFSVGFLKNEVKLNDLIFEFSPKNLKCLKIEMKKYYNVINNHI
mgnify:FL=1